MAHRRQTLMSSLASVCVAVLALGAPTAVFAVDEEEARAAAAVAKSQASPGDLNSTQLGGYTLRWRPYVETEGGVDTNPDNLVEQDGTGLVKVEAGMKTTLERANEYYAFTLKGRYLDFMDIAADKNRKDFKAGFDTVQNLSETETLSAGTYFLRDMISFDHVDIAHSYAEYALRTDTYRIKLTGKNHTEHNFDDEKQGTQIFDDFVVSRPKAFDYSRSDAQLSVLTFTNQMLQPFVIYDFGHINYYNQVEGASIDRDAIENFAIAGIRFQFDENFRIDVGYRYNTRDFEDATIAEHDTDFIDVNVFWKPFDTLRLTGVVERYYDESTTSFGLVDDVETYGMTFEWDVAPKWRLAGTTFYDRERALGDDALYDKITSTMSITHDVNDNLEIFVSGLAKWVDEDVSGDTYDRYKIGTGARLNF